MKRLSLITALLFFPALLFPGAASAQVAGVPVDAVTPAGLERLEVNVPEYEGHGVRLYFAPEGQTRAHVRIDLLVAPDHRGANDAVGWFEQTVQGDLPVLSGIGTEARGDSALVAFVRDNVFVVVRRLGGAHDISAIARSVDGVIQAAPRGAALSSVRIALPELGQGTTPVQLPEGVLAAHVVASGSASARRTAEGWLIVRRGQADAHVTVVACDRMLRRVRAER